MQHLMSYARSSIIVFATVLACSNANAGYVVVDDDLMPTKTQQQDNKSRYVPQADNDVHETYPISFKRGTWTLSDQAVESLGTLFPLIENNKIVVIGRPDGVANQSLADQRAKAIRIWLLRQGIPPSQIEVRIKNVPNTLTNGQYPVELLIPQTYSNAPSPMVTPVRNQYPQNTATAVADYRIETIRQITLAAQAGRIDARASIQMIAELLAAGQKSNTALLRTTAIQEPEFGIVATPETKRIGDWKISKELTLKDNVVEYAKQAGYTVDWQANNYYKIGKNSTLPGDLLDNVNRVVTSVGLTMTLIKKDKIIRITDS